MSDPAKEIQRWEGAIEVFDDGWTSGRRVIYKPISNGEYVLHSDHLADVARVKAEAGGELKRELLLIAKSQCYGCGNEKHLYPSRLHDQRFFHRGNWGYFMCSASAIHARLAALSAPADDAGEKAKAHPLQDKTP